MPTKKRKIRNRKSKRYRGGNPSNIEDDPVSVDSVETGLLMNTLFAKFNSPEFILPLLKSLDQIDPETIVGEILGLKNDIKEIRKSVTSLTQENLSQPGSEVEASQLDSGQSALNTQGTPSHVGSAVLENQQAAPIEGYPKVSAVPSSPITIKI